MLDIRLAFERHLTRANSSLTLRIALIVALVCGLGITEAQAGNEMFIEFQSVWKYLDTGVNLGTTWRAPFFDDSTWASGAGELGYGDGDEMTVVGYGPSPGNKYITTYFRRSFNIVDVSKYTSLLMRLWRDDGAVVYLNGTEVWRVNMPSGPVIFSTRASTGTLALETTTIAPSLLVNGTNVIAVEIHQFEPGSSDITFDFEMSGSDPALPATVVRGPYLQQGTPSSVIVRWRTDVATDSRVRYGTTQANLNLTADVATVTTEHEVSLSALSPETTYYYSVGTTTMALTGNPDDGQFFITPPPIGVSRPTRIWALGDSGLQSIGAHAVRNRFMKLAGATYTNLWLMLGNNAYNNGLDAEYQAEFFEQYPRTLRKTVVWPTLGGHDTGGIGNPPPSLPYYSIFSLPTGGEAGGLASGTENYYSFNYGNIHFISLDSQASSRSPSGPMVTWLQSDLASNLQPWVIAYWHHPPYSRGSTNSDSRTQSIEMRQNIVPVLEAAGVDLVISADSHSYERSFLIDGHYGSSSTFTDSMKKNGGSGSTSGSGPYIKPGGIVPREGAVYAVTGSGATTGGGPLNHPAMFISANSMGSMVLDIDGNRLDARFLRNDGVVADSFTIIKSSTPIPPPADPTGLTATAISSSRIDLVWADNSNNENGFRIEQSTNGGATFSLAATTGINATARSITGLAPATTYHYRVRAFNSGGESANSNTENATTFHAPPAAPTGLTATTISISQIDLTWVDNATTEDGFRIELSTNGGTTFTLATTTGANATTRSISGLLQMTTYHFRVRAFNTGGESANSNTASATTLQAPPAAPSSLTATAISSSQINLAWADNANNETGFRIDQSTDGGATFVLAATTVANVTARSITGLAALTTYHYRVRAFNSFESANSNTANATTTNATAPIAPAGLTGTTVSASRIDLRWQDKSSNEEGFKIERCTGSGCVALTQVAQVGTNVITFSDTGLATNTTYRYRVRSFNAAGNSSYSNSVQATTTEAAGAVLVRTGSVWKYLDNGSNQGTAWRAVSFDDSAWASGPAKLGYGDGDEATVVSYGPSAGAKYFTTYFRRAFSVADPSVFTGLALQLKRDDGAVVYLNGVEVWRVDMPAGNITYTTAASVATDAVGFLETTISPNLLVSGANVIAVEIHQVDHGSSDIGLDLQLLGSGPGIVANSGSQVLLDISTNVRSTRESVFQDDPSGAGGSLVFLPDEQPLRGRNYYTAFSLLLNETTGEPAWPERVLGGSISDHLTLRALVR